MEHMIREIIQNSLDAPDPRHLDKPVIVRMGKIELTPDMVGSKSLKPHVQGSMECMKKDNQIQGAKFCKDALKMLERRTIPTLAITDENTTGLTIKKWEALVYKEGTPNKEGQTAAGGNFGIGKNAPYAVSKLRMVCYSTRYLNHHRTEKFIARCKLVAHPNPSNPEDELQHIGFGNSEPLKNSRFPPIEGNNIHKAFRLPRSGSGIFIVGFDEPDWEEAAKRSIARNFFTAIHEKKLQVVVNGESITNETLNDLDFGKDSYRGYYEIIKKTGKLFKINGDFGSFELRVATGEETMKNQIAYINRRGMLITEERRFKKNPFHPRLSGIGKFVAVIRAVDDETDARVRQMEPPTHEAIEYERLSNRDERIKTEKELREIQKKIADYIKKELNIDLLNKKTELTELSNILPFISDDSTEWQQGQSGNEPNEKVEHRQLPVPSPTSSTVDDRSGGPSGVEESDVQEKGGAEESDGEGGDVQEKGGFGDGSKSGKSGKDPKKKSRASVMDSKRIIRYNNTLRIAFTPRAGIVRFAVKPAGEEPKPEVVIPITDVKTISSDCKVSTLDDNTITVRTKRNKRVILDLSISQGESYTGYEVTEYETGGNRR